MPPTDYQSRNRVNSPDIAERKAAYEDLSTMLHHLEALGVRMQSLSISGGGKVLVRLSDAIDPEQAAHLGLEL